MRDGDKVMAKSIAKWSIMAVVGLVGLLAFGFAVAAAAKQYKVWSFDRDGQAELAKAQSNRLIQLEEAKAKRLSATELAAAEIERAKGVAEANRIIGESLEGNEGYLRYLWIQGLHDGTSEVIYIPTEANLPILEARGDSRIER